MNAESWAEIASLEENSCCVIVQRDILAWQ